MANDNTVSTEKNTSDDGRTNGKTIQDKGDHYHVTSYVTLQNGLSMRSSYDIGKNNGDEPTGAHFHDNSKK